MIGVVVLTYNTWEATEECINSFYAVHDSRIFKMYVVDNASPKMITEKCKLAIRKYGVKLLHSDNNKGYAAGNNVGIRQAISDGCSHILISNNDIVYMQNILTTMMDDFKRLPNSAIIAPRIMLPSGELQETNLGCKMSLKGKYLYILRKTPLRRLSNNFVDKFRVDIASKEDLFQNYGVSGCCFMITAEALQKINLFDEHTFLYEEENILSAQISEINKDVWIDPKIQVIHKHGFTTRNAKALAFKAHVESEIYYCKRYLESTNVSILPLVLVRVAEFCTNLNKDDYRNSFSDFIKGIIKELSYQYWHTRR